MVETKPPRFLDVTLLCWLAGQLSALNSRARDSCLTSEILISAIAKWEVHPLPPQSGPPPSPSTTSHTRMFIRKQQLGCKPRVSASQYITGCWKHYWYLNKECPTAKIKLQEFWELLNHVTHWLGQFRWCSLRTSLQQHLWVGFKAGSNTSSL